MTFQPLLPVGGLTGWNFLNRTIESQKLLQNASPVAQREMNYFRENIGNISSAEQLVGDFTLMKVALSAFGLQEDVSNKFFIRKVLEEGVIADDSLANRLSDARYAALSKAFGFGGLGEPRTALSSFPDEILSAYEDQTFEVAVGDVQPELRLALGLERELETVLENSSSADARWYGVMGSSPLREVFETALNLPETFAALDIDQQLVVFRARSEEVFGLPEVADFIDPNAAESLRNRYLLMNEINNGQASLATSPALSLLTGISGGFGTTSLLSVLYSG
ncbi:DUF1217 domain-containing protein [Meridianimarinicoccus aquatilis]|uniref:DUF1217 domain-containing protein n=1 Tax=Meridianimarinicoccus aquatilis TaxID=2552766 RepID=A0A4R6ASP4_9RHOB|nr:DUF1217 domain-containing protein [Fluviibacterium aquatile]TDL84919.1 DUF1217 domain-containing protein [Fluviibacterium aquatile]TDL87007.1 DUF1217 domain-containing protein [Fluviibacterium aquatile]